jgi:carboxymethylenebutenolidase
VCFDYDALPPDLPRDLVCKRLAGGAAAEQIEVEAADGNRFAAAIAQVDDGSEPGVIILPDVRGLFRFYIQLAERFAAAGRNAIALDYFGRTAGVEERGADFEYWPHVMETSVESVQLDIAAARDALRDRTGTRSAVTVGFCFGGSHSFIAGTNADLDLAGVVGFYGTLDPTRINPNIPDRFPAPLRVVGQTTAPVLGLFGGADQNIPAEDVAKFGEELDAVGVDHEIVTYPGAPHSFFDRSAEQHADASEDAWRRIFGFLDRIPSSTAA